MRICFHGESATRRTESSASTGAQVVFAPVARMDGRKPPADPAGICESVSRHVERQRDHRRVARPRHRFDQLLRLHHHHRSNALPADRDQASGLHRWTEAPDGSRVTCPGCAARRSRAAFARAFRSFRYANTSSHAHHGRSDRRAAHARSPSLDALPAQDGAALGRTRGDQAPPLASCWSAPFP